MWSHYGQREYATDPFYSDILAILFIFILNQYGCRNLAHFDYASKIFFTIHKMAEKGKSNVIKSMKTKMEESPKKEEDDRIK